MSEELEVTCPSGMVGLIRPLSVPEERSFKNAATSKQSDTIRRFIAGHWVKLVNPGPYNFEGDKIDWGKVLSGDSMFLLLQSRAMTYGKELPTVLQCQACGGPIKHTINVLEDFLEQRLPPDSVEHVRDGVPLTMDHNGKQIQFRLLRMEDDRQINRIKNMRDLSAEQASLAVKVTAIEDVDCSGFGVIRWIEAMPASEPDEILEEMEEYDCGIDTEFEVVCKKKNCLFDQEFTLPFSVEFFQRADQKRRKRKEARKKAAMERKLMRSGTAAG
jgi:hypothetical protein